VNKIEFAVRKKTGPPNSAENVAWFAFNAAFILDRAFTIQRSLAFVNDKNIEVGVFGEKMGSEESGRASSNNDDIKICFYFIFRLGRIWG
jgi:hypothetical protein